MLGCLWTIHNRCTCKWKWIEMLTIYFPLRTKQTRSTEDVQIKLKCRETRQVQERLVSTWEHMQVPKWDRARCPDCMNSASYEYRKMPGRRGAQFVPIWMPTTCLRTFPAKTNVVTKSSRILIISSSDYLFF